MGTYRLLPLIITVFLQACAASNYLPAFNAQQAVSFDASIAAYPSPKGREINMPAMDLNIWLPGISGELYGTADSEALLRAHKTAQQYHFNIDASLLAGLNQQAKKHRSNTLQITPQDARLLRIAATANHPYTGQALGDTFWQDQRRQTPLVLLYTDQAVQIEGELDINGTVIKHDIQLPAAGLYWLRQTNRFRTQVLSLSPPPTAVEIAIKAVD